MERPDVPDDERQVVPEPDDPVPSSDREAPEADALDQATAVEGVGWRNRTGELPLEASEGDALDQAEEVGGADDTLPTDLDTPP